jgi:putative intracellular protease/amidase
MPINPVTIAHAGESKILLVLIRQLITSSYACTKVGPFHRCNFAHGCLNNSLEVPYPLWIWGAYKDAGLPPVPHNSPAYTSNMKSFAAFLLVPLLAAAHLAPPAPPAAPKPPPVRKPLKFGVLLFQGFQTLDVFGPLDVLNTLSFTERNISLSVIARSLDAVTTIPINSNGTFGEKVVVTHTFDNPPAGLEVLLVPGGNGPPSEFQPEIDFVRKIVPTVRYVIAVCTGNALLARAGVLDGKKATGNKRSWAWLTTTSDKVHWIAKARWVVSSPKIWSTSGISAGVDGTLNWVSTVYGEAVAEDLALTLEWRRVTDPSDDEFADKWGAKDVLPVKGPKPPKN